MAPSKDKQPVTHEPAGEQPAGRVEFDNRGRNVWRWAREALDSTSILLKRLENKDLALEPTRKVPIMRGGPADNSDRVDKAVELKRLENKDLALEPTRKLPIMRGGAGGKADKVDKTNKTNKTDKAHKAGNADEKSGGKNLGPSAEHGGHDGHGGFDPYNSRR
ncbi:MAG TPA: hypothetical protein VMU03_03385 [Gammaproteobacteria bacterium]|jgi:hypothetical protein|nr:hypothetical protein [Gammaproteobacteria bacterium]